MTAEIVHVLVQRMAHWTASETAEWSVLAALDLSPSQLIQVAALNSDEMSQVTGIIASGKTILDSISGLVHQSKQENIIKLIRYSEYRNLFYQPSLNIITYDPSHDVVINLPPPTINLMIQQSYYGYQTPEWVQVIQSQFRASPLFNSSTFQLDVSAQRLAANIQVNKTAPGYYLMSFYDPQNYPQNIRQANTLVWDSSGQENLWYKYLHIPYASEILISDLYTTPLPDPSYVLLQTSKQYDLSGNFNIPPTQVPILTENNYINYSIPELFGFEHLTYTLNTYRSNTFYGSTYNYDTLFPQQTPQLQTPAFQVEVYDPQVQPRNPNQPVGYTNYTQTDTCGNVTADTSNAHHVYYSVHYPLAANATNRYSYLDIIQAINTTIAASPWFTSDSRLWIQDAATQTDVSDITLLNDIGTYYYHFTLKLDRKQIYRDITNRPNQKCVLQFLDPLWTTALSFNFPHDRYEFGNLTSEYAPITNTIYYTAPLSVQFICTAPGFRTPLNDTSFSLPPPGNPGYSYVQFLNAINVALAAPPLTAWGLTGTIANRPTDHYAVFTTQINYVIPASDPVQQTPNFRVDFSRSIFATFTSTPDPWIIESSGTVFTFTGIQVPGIFNLNPSNQNIYVTCQGPQQATTVTIPIPLTNAFNTYNAGQTVYTVTDLINTMNATVFGRQTTNHVSLYGSRMTYNANSETISLYLVIQSILTNQDYSIVFIDPSATTHTANTISAWSRYLGINDASYAYATDLCNNQVIGTIPALDKTIYLTPENNYFTLKPVPDPLGGVYINATTDPVISNNGRDNDLVIQLTQLPTYQYYTINDILNAINTQFDNYSNQYGQVLYGSSITVDSTINHTVIRFNVNTIYTTKDYVLDFFDVESFTQCEYGPSASIQSAKWNTTLGWLLGFHSQSIYEVTPANQTNNLSNQTTYYAQFPGNLYTYDISSNIVRIRGDSAISVNLYNYLLLVLDDYTQSHINDGLITITQSSTDVPLNSYSVRNTALKCLPGNTNPANPVTGQYVQNQQEPKTQNNLTSKQVYSLNQILNARNALPQTPFQTTYGPNLQDIFGIIPLKTAGLQIGQSYIEFGGTLQNQDRVFFGPVNIKRLTVRLLTDKGVILNLNNANWSFSLVVQQLYTSNKSSK